MFDGTFNEKLPHFSVYNFKNKNYRQILHKNNPSPKNPEASQSRDREYQCAMLKSFFFENNNYF